MAITRIECPECGAGLKSPSGFAPGQSVECPKCETIFAVELPADDDDRPAKAKKPVKAAASRSDDDDDVDEKPRKKKKKSRDDDDDDERSYKTSPMRFVVLGVLVVIMIVLGVMLILKKQREKEEAKAGTDAVASNRGDDAPGQVPKITFVPPGRAQLQPLQAGGVGVAAPKGAGQPPLPPVRPDPVGELFGASPTAGSAESKQLIESLSAKLVGTWEGSAGGTTHTITYQPNGNFTHQFGNSTQGGTWKAVGLVGRRGLKLSRGAETIKVVFEDDELVHDTATPGETVVLRKK